MFHNTNLITGAGISGAIIARKIADTLDERVLVIDKKEHIAGNCFDYKDNNSITVHKYGSHIFHTNNDEIWKFLNKFSVFNTYMHKVFALIDGIKTTIPFNFNTLYDVFPKSLAQSLEFKLLQAFEYNSKIPILEFKKTNDKDLNFLADYIYKKVFLNYTLKQWGASPKEIDNAVTARVPVLLSRDSRYFQDKYQGIPQKGYSNLIQNILNHPNIEVKLNTDFKDIRQYDFKRIFFTGSIDEFFDYKFGALSYRSVSFKFEEYEMPYYQENSVVNYPDNYDFTRIHEYKYYLNENSKKTVIAKEFSSEYVLGKNDGYYPVCNNTNIELYNKYKYMAKDLKNVWFLGRLGDYKYYDMDKAAQRALECFDEVFQNVIKI